MDTSLQARLTLNTADYRRGLADAAQRASQALGQVSRLMEQQQRTLDHVGQTAAQVSGRFSRLGSATSSVLGGMGSGFNSLTGAVSRTLGVLTSLQGLVVGGLGLYALHRTVSGLTDAWAAQELAQTKLYSITQSMNRGLPEVAKGWIDYASALQRASTAGDEQIIAGTALLATFDKITNEAMPQAMQTMVDLAALTGGDMTSAALTLGKASEGLTGELRRMGISISEASEKSKDFNSIMADIRRQVGGLGAELAATDTGSMLRFKNAWGDIIEVAGKFLTIIEGQAARILLPFLQDAERDTKAWVEANEGLIRQKVPEYLTSAAEAAGTLVQAVVLARGAFAAFGTSAGLAAETIIGGYANILEAFEKILSALNYQTRMGTGVFDAQIASVRKYREEIVDLWAEIETRLEKNMKTVSETGGAYRAVEEKIKSLKERIKGFRDEQDEATQAVKTNTAAMDRNRRSLQGAADDYHDLTLASEEMVRAFITEDRHRTDSFENLDRLNQGLLTSQQVMDNALSDFLRQDRERTDAFLANQGRMQGGVKDTGEEINRIMDTAWGNTLSTIADRLASWMTGQKDAWKDFGQAIGELFARAFSQVVVNLLASTISDLFKEIFKGITTKSIGSSIGSWISGLFGGGGGSGGGIGRIFSSIGSWASRLFGGGGGTAAASSWESAMAGLGGGAGGLGSFASFWGSWMGPAALYGIPFAAQMFGPMLGQMLGIGSGNTSWTSRMSQRYGSQREMLEAAQGPYWGDFVDRLHLLQGADEGNWEDYFRRAMTGYQHYTWLAGQGGMTQAQMNAYAQANLSPERYQMYTRLPEQYDVFNQISNLERSYNEWYGQNQDQGNWPLAQWLRGQSGTVQALLREAEDLNLREQFEPVVDQFRQGTITFEEMVNQFRQAVRDFEGSVDQATTGESGLSAISLSEARTQLEALRTQLLSADFMTQALGSNPSDAMLQMFRGMRINLFELLNAMLAGDNESLATSIKEISFAIQNMTTSAGILRGETDALANGTDRLTAVTNTLQSVWNALVFGNPTATERQSLIQTGSQRLGTVAGLQAQMSQYEAMQAWATGDASQAGLALAALSDEATRTLLQNDLDLVAVIQRTGFNLGDLANITDQTLAQLDEHLRNLSGPSLTELNTVMTHSQDVYAATTDRARELAEALNLENPINTMIEALDSLVVAMLRITFQATGAEGSFKDYVARIMGDEWMNRYTAATARDQSSPFGTGYQHGTDYVPKTGRYLLHEGEAVIPAVLNRAGLSFGQAAPVTTTTHIHRNVFNLTVDAPNPPDNPQVIEQWGRAIARELAYYERGSRR